MTVKCLDRTVFMAKRLSVLFYLLVAGWGAAHGAGPAVDVKTLKHEKLGYSLPFVVSSDPGVGRRINDEVFDRLLGLSAPETLQDGMALLEQQSSTEGSRSLALAQYLVIRNDDRLLILEVEGEGCGAYCESFTQQFLFDTRTGRAIHPEDLFTDAGSSALAQRLKSAQIRSGKALLASARRKESLQEGEDATYSRCLADWARSEPRLWPLAANFKGQWRFTAGTCSAHVNRGSDLLDRLDVPVTLAQLVPHLNAYGKSLLMRVGDVRDPALTSLQCKKGAEPRPAASTSDRSDVVVVAAGRDHHLLLQKQGRLWAWGRNGDGQMGHVDPPANSGAWIPPVLVGDDFVQVAAGFSHSAGIRRDGTLWTWGHNYLGVLGDGGTANRARPVQIGKDFVQVTMDSQRAMALQRNGALWAWGSEQLSEKDPFGRELYRLTPRQLASDVAQMEFFAPFAQAITLKTDGSIWIIGETGERKVGDGFTRLAARNAKAAFKADGSLWAWEETLAALATLRGNNEGQPAQVGQGFVKVTVAYPNFVVALKEDGSLWASHWRGASASFEPVGCGFMDVVTLGHADARPPHGAWVAALKRDGNLIAWGNWKGEAEASWVPQRNLFNQPPITLGSGFVSLHQVPNLWGQLGGRMVAVKADGSIWQSTPIEASDTTLPKELLQKVEFPAASLQSGR